MRKRFFKFTVGAVLFVVLLFVGLWLVAPVFAKNKAIERAQAMGLTMTVNSVNRSDGGYLFEGIHISSKELPIEADIDQAMVIVDGSKLRALTVHGGKVVIHGRVSEVRGQWQLWRDKHRGHGSGEKAIIMADKLQLTWQAPCGGEDASAMNVSVNNTDLVVRASEASANCLGWKAHSTDVKASLQSVEIGKLEITRSGVTGPATASLRNLDTREFPVQGSIPNLVVGELNVDDKPHTLHAKNLVFRGDSDSSDTAYTKFSFDEMEADLPRVHKVNLGKTETEGWLSDLSSDGYALFSLTVKSDGARGKVQGVTGNRVTLGTTELVLAGSLPPDSTWKSPHIVFDERTHVKVEEVQVNFKGEWKPGRLQADVELPDTDCQKLLDAVPAGMNRAITGLKMKGSAEMQLHVEKNDSLAEPVVKLHLFDHCKVTSPPDGADRATLRSSFMRVVQGPMGEGVEIPTGPSSGKWMPLSDVSPFLVDAIQVTEDPGFFGHYGFEPSAIEESLKTDISLGRFARGASTVTMQLAKNLWLSREKTIARKIQEAFLTIYLEQTLSKQEILETYFNVVEFGPMVYGITDAANFYFNTVPSNLTLSQALFLCSILPNPKQNWFGADGQLQPGRLKWLQTLMVALEHRHLITQAQYEEGVTEIPVRGMPKPARTSA
jgi:hypothetical protein